MYPTLHLVDLEEIEQIFIKKLPSLIENIKERKLKKINIIEFFWSVLIEESANNNIYFSTGDFSLAMMVESNPDFRSKYFYDFSTFNDNTKYKFENFFEGVFIDSEHVKKLLNDIENDNNFKTFCEENTGEYFELFIKVLNKAKSLNKGIIYNDDSISIDGIDYNTIVSKFNPQNIDLEGMKIYIEHVLEDLEQAGIKLEDAKFFDINFEI